MENVLVLLLALVLDLALGEPRDSWHPVAWLGKLISLQSRTIPKSHRLAQLAYGTGMVLATLGLIVVPVYFLLVHLRETNAVIYVVVTAPLLKFTFSFRGLSQAVRQVKRSLAEGNLTQARICMRSLAGRDTSDLSQNQLMSAAVESTAENTCDSFVAPLFYFLLFGVPGAIAYRIVNTFDSMVGYHGEHEYSGKFAARLDDAANFLPARLAGLIEIVAARLCRKNVAQAWRIMLRDHGRTQSPNAGWTMGAMAGALGVRLEKAGHYQLGDNHRSLSLDTTAASLQITTVVAIAWSLLALSAEVIYLVAT